MMEVLHLVSHICCTCLTHYEKYSKNKWMFLSKNHPKIHLWKHQDFQSRSYLLENWWNNVFWEYIFLYNFATYLRTLQYCLFTFCFCIFVIYPLSIYEILMFVCNIEQPLFQSTSGRGPRIYNLPWSFFCGCLPFSPILITYKSYAAQRARWCITEWCTDIGLVWKQPVTNKQYRSEWQKRIGVRHKMITVTTRKKDGCCVSNYWLLCLPFLVSWGKCVLWVENLYVLNSQVLTCSEPSLPYQQRPFARAWPMHAK